MTTDIFNVQRGIVGKGAGDDTYILSPELIDAGAQITITDAAGANTIQLIGGLEITASQTAATAIQLTLSNGAVVTVLGADSYTFALGGNPLTGEAPNATTDFAGMVDLLDSTPAFTVNGAPTVDITTDNAEAVLAAVKAVDASASTVQEVADNAAAAATTAATTAALTDADGVVHADVDAAITSNDTAISDAATTAALTDGDGVVHADVDAAITSNDTAISDAATTAALTDADGVVHASVDAAMDAADDDEQAQLDADAAELAAAGFADLTDLINAYTDLIAPKALTFSSTSAETLNGGVGDDTFTGSGANYTNADVARDTSSTDNDTANITVTTDITPNIAGVENVNLTINSSTTKIVTASSLSGVDTLTLTRGDVTVGDAIISGNKAHDINALDASDVANVVIAGTATSVTLDQSTKAGVDLNADVASGSVTVIGAATVNAAGAGAGDTVTVEAMENAEAGSAALALVENAKAVTINTNAASVTVIDSSADGNDFTGAITVTANNASSVNVDNITGGGSVTATRDGADITVADIDASGVTITAGSGTATNTSTITLDGSAATTTAVDVATVSASGEYTTLVLGGAQAIDTINLSGNGAAVTYTVTGTTLPTTYAASGDHAVTLAGNESVFSGAVISGVAVIDLTAGTAGAIDAADWSAGKVDLGFDNNAGAGNAITVGSDVTYEVTSDQTGLDFDFATGANGNVTIIAGDDNGTSTAVGTITTAALDANAGATSTGTLTIEASIANVSGSTLTVGALQEVVITGDEDVSFTGVVTAASVDASESSGIITMTGLTSGVDSVTTGSGADVITVNDATTDHQVTTNAGNDTVTITATQNGLFVTGAGNDTINVDDVTGSYVVNAGEGADTVVLSGDADAILIGGDDTDILRVDGAAAIQDNTNATLNGFETFDLDAALTLNSSQWAANNSTAVISSSSSDGTLNLGGTGSDTAGITIDASALTATSGFTGYTVTIAGVNLYDDVLTGGVLAETFTQTSGNDQIEGGATGTDTFTLMNEADIDGTASGDNMNGVVVNLGATSIDEATIVAQTGNHLGEAISTVSTGTATFTFANASASAAGAVNVSYTQIIGGIENVTGGDGDDYIVGSSDNNALAGGAGADYINGGDGDDTITGGAGADTLAGGLGADTFVNADIDNNGTDSITDFATTVDNITLSLADLNALTGAATFTAGDVVGTDAGAFVEFLDGAGNVAATTTAGTFIYNADTGELIFDASGDSSYDDATGVVTDTAGDDIVFADLGAGATGDIVAADLTIIA